MPDSPAEHEQAIADLTKIEAFVDASTTVIADLRAITTAQQETIASLSTELGESHASVVALTTQNADLVTKGDEIEALVARISGKVPGPPVEDPPDDTPPDDPPAAN